MYREMSTDQVIRQRARELDRERERKAMKEELRQHVWEAVRRAELERRNEKVREWIASNEGWFSYDKSIRDARRSTI